MGTGSVLPESWDAWLCYLGVGKEREGRGEDSETWGRLTRVLGCKTPGELKSYKAWKKPTATVSRVSAGHGYRGWYVWEWGVTSTEPFKGEAAR